MQQVWISFLWSTVMDQYVKLASDAQFWYLTSKKCFSLQSAMKPKDFTFWGLILYSHATKLSIIKSLIVNKPPSNLYPFLFFPPSDTWEWHHVVLTPLRSRKSLSAWVVHCPLPLYLSLSHQRSPFCEREIKFLICMSQEVTWLLLLVQISCIQVQTCIELK